MDDVAAFVSTVQPPPPHEVLAPRSASLTHGEIHRQQVPAADDRHRSRLLRPARPAAPQMAGPVR
jgi:hypothetical protein